MKIRTSCILPKIGAHKPVNWLRMQPFCLQLEASCLQLRFFAYNCAWELLCLQLELVNLQFELFCLQLSFFAYNGKVFLRSTSTDCKQRSSTVSKKAPTVSRKAAPLATRFESFGRAVTCLYLKWIMRHDSSRGQTPLPNAHNNALKCW